MKMEVKLIDYQVNALELLLYTKNTRLQANCTLQDIINWPMETKLDHLDYMRHTIKSSWEFAHYVFEINGVSRNFTHQLVRTRTQSYAQESQRTVDVRQSDCLGCGINPVYDLSVEQSKNTYANLVNDGMAVGDARNILPSGIFTSIIVGTDLRTIHETAKTRLCKRTQGEYQDVFKKMKEEIIKVHPWAESFINVACVDSGMCIFPNYTECPVQDYTLRVSQGTKNRINEAWENCNHVANPKAKNGKSM